MKLSDQLTQDKKAENPIITMKMGCMLPISTALTTGIRVKARKYATSPKTFAANATYTSADSCRLSILRFPLLVITI